jgi:hypothetical protein
MRILHNEKGIALITSLMFTVLSLVMTMALLSMITAGMKSSGAMKRYKTTNEAAYGGMDIILKDLITANFGHKDETASGYLASMNGYLGNLVDNNSLTLSTCLQEKLKFPKSQWSASCKTDVSLNAKSAFDVSFNLNATPLPGQTAQPYTVYSKIVDTMDRKFVVFRNHSSITITQAGNSDTSTFALEGGSTTDGAGVSVPHYPYMYRIEIQAERAQNALEKSKISIQYAY